MKFLLTSFMVGVSAIQKKKIDTFRAVKVLINLTSQLLLNLIKNQTGFILNPIMIPVCPIGHIPSSNCPRGLKWSRGF